jgi:hypothetical protein
MSNTNTDQKFLAAQMNPITAPTAATITYVQLNTTGNNNGVTAGNAKLPIPGQFKAQNKVVRVKLYYSVFGATVGSQALTVTINFVNNASTPATAIVATTGAVTCAGLGGVATQYLYLQAEWLEPAIGGAATSVIRGGIISGVTVSSTTTQALVTSAVLTGQPVFTATNITGAGAAEGLDESQYFEAAITLAVADSTFVFTPLEFSVELA